MSIPLRAQYLRLKQPFPNALLFFRLGDVYELYDGDAEVIARELGLALVTREVVRGECVPLCSVPYPVSEGYMRRLVARGHKVAVCEQIGDPRGTEGLAEREVVRVITPCADLGDHRHDTVVAAQPSGVVASASPPMVDVPTDTSRESPLGDAQGTASDKGARAGAAIQLPLFGALAGSDATVSAPVQEDDRRTIQVGLF